MELGAPRGTSARMQKPVWNGFIGDAMGAGNQGKTVAAQYAHAHPPFWNSGSIVVLEQLAYFSA
jgi:hypothetical protein